MNVLFPLKVSTPLAALIAVTSIARRNSQFKIQTGIQHKRFVDLECVVYLRCAVLVY